MSRKPYKLVYLRIRIVVFNQVLCTLSGNMAEQLTRSYIKVDLPVWTLKHQTFPEAMKHYAETKPDGESVVFVSTDGTRECVTWFQLYQRSQIMAKSLIKMGIQRHEVVTINVRCCPEWLYATFGAMMAGAIPVSISFTYTDGSDLIALMKKMETCSLLILDPGADSINWNILRKLLDEYKADGRAKSHQMPYLKYVLGVRFDGHPDATFVKDISDLLAEDHPEVELPVIKPDDLYGLFQTSGSTGVPKLVSNAHKSSLKMAGALEISEVLNPRYILFNDRPFNWGGGYPFSILTGQTRVTFSEFCDPPTDRLSYMINVIVKEKCAMVIALPPLINELIKRQVYLIIKHFKKRDLICICF
jgi:acyl-CoA synthetase (AMP-forming)/AMP-acid ligase II